MVENATPKDSENIKYVDFKGYPLDPHLDPIVIDDLFAIQSAPTRVSGLRSIAITADKGINITRSDANQLKDTPDEKTEEIGTLLLKVGEEKYVYIGRNKHYRISIVESDIAIYGFMLVVASIQPMKEQYMSALQVRELLQSTGKTTV